MRISQPRSVPFHFSVSSASLWLILLPVHRRMDGRLQHLPREQATLLAVRGQAGAVEGQHVAGRELLSFVDGFTLHFFEEHRGRSLANDAALPVEVGIADFAVVAELQLDANHIAAERVVILVCVGSGRQLATVERVLVTIEDAPDSFLRRWASNTCRVERQVDDVQSSLRGAHADRPAAGAGRREKLAVENRR